MIALPVQANARCLPLADESVDLIITSPPYFALRSYRDGDQHYEGQVGSEPTPQAFLEALWEVTKECWRVLKPTGSLFVNLGDKRSGSGGHNNSGLTRSLPRVAKGYAEGTAHKRAGTQVVAATRRNAPDRYNQAAFGRPKSKMLLPHRFAIGCEDGMADPDGIGWIVRQDIVWSKPNCLSGGAIVYAQVKGRPLAIKVHDLCRAYQPADVKLWNGSAWTQVVWWEPTPRTDGGQVELVLRSGERIGCTLEHRWPTQRGLVAADDIVVGDVLETARLPEGEATPEALDDEMVGWFVGLYIAEGSRSERMIQMAGHLNELARFKRLEELAQAFHGTCHVYATGGNAASINLSGNLLHAILDTYVGGRTAKDKHLQPKAWQRSNRFLRAVLDGYLSGDGHQTDDGRWVVGFTANDSLASDLRVLAARLGFSARLRRTTHTGFGKEWPGWHGNIVMDPTRRRRPDSEVVALDLSRARQFWDIGVADDPHLFALASGVLTHNSLPESVTDRVRDSHEYWFQLTKQGRYFSAVDEVREPHAASTMSRGGGRNGARVHPGGVHAHGLIEGKRGWEGGTNVLGALPGSVWTIPSEPLTIPEAVKAHYNLPDHFAAFPQEWPRRLILGWSPSGICVACGEGRRPVVAKTLEETGQTNRRKGAGKRDNNEWDGNDRGYNASGYPIGRTEVTITGYACACPDTSAPTRPSVVADVFGGTGTVAGVARQLGRIGLSFDLSHDYSRLAQYFLRDGRRFAKTSSRTDRERQGQML